jgi:hypothetical protein
MPAPAPKPTLWLAAVAALMALLAGLVGSARRAATHPRALAPLEPRLEAGPRETVLATPRPIAEVAPAPAPERSANPPPVVAAPPARVLGLVLRPDGEPAAGASVKLGGQRARASNEGRFELVLVAGLAGQDLIAHLTGFEPAVLARFGDLSVGREDVRLVLGPATLPLTGTVIDAAGLPLKGWTVELDGPDALRDYGLREPVRTDIEGRFVLNDVPAGVHVVRAWKKQRERAVLSAPATTGEQGLTIVVGADE